MAAVVPPARQKRLASEVRVVMHRLKEVRRDAAEEVAANVEIKHESKAVLYRVQQAMKRERHLVSEAASQAAAARDILVRAPCVLQVIREAASQLGCSHKLSGDIGTPVNKSIITKAMAGESSQFDKLHAAVNSYLDEQDIAPYSASRDTVHRLLRYARVKFDTVKPTFTGHKLGVHYCSSYLLVAWIITLLFSAWAAKVNIDAMRRWRRMQRRRRPRPRSRSRS